MTAAVGIGSLSRHGGCYYTKVIAATASDAPHVLDGLLYHQTGLQIEEHYTDTGGATDHVFGLCHLFGFRFAPRIRTDVSPTIVAHVAPLGWEHVGLTGDYVWSDGQQPSNGSLRPLRRRESMLAA
jgi:hypothetical protein